MGEAGQLLIEGRADVAAPASLTVATIESAGLRDGDILLLEEGAPPIKGSSLLKVCELTSHLPFLIYLTSQSCICAIGLCLAAAELLTPYRGSCYCIIRRDE